MRRYILTGIAVFIVIVILILDSHNLILDDHNTKMVSNSPATPKEILNNSRTIGAISDPEKYRDYPVNISGKVMKVKGKELSIVIEDDKKQKGYATILSPNLSIYKDGDFISVKGNFKGNMIIADSIEKIDAKEVLAPTKHIVEVNKTDEVDGYVINLKKVEFAEAETRVFITVENKSKGTISFNKHESKVLQGQKQYDYSYVNYSIKYPEVQSDMLPGVLSEGILVFPLIDYNAKKANFIISGSSPAGFGMAYKRTANFDVTWN